MPIRPINRNFRLEVKPPPASPPPTSPPVLPPPPAPDRDPGASIQPSRAPVTLAAPAAPVPGKARRPKSLKAKKQPTGDYEEGYCRPPVRTRFDGSKPGPGRPRGSVSQDTLLKKHLTQVRPVAIEGKATKVQARELILMLRIKEALSGNRHAADYVLSEAARLFSERETAGGQEAPAVPIDVDAHDAAILEGLRSVLLAGAADESDPQTEDELEGEMS